MRVPKSRVSLKGGYVTSLKEIGDASHFCLDIAGITLWLLVLATLLDFEVGDRHGNYDGQFSACMTLGRSKVDLPLNISAVIVLSWVLSHVTVWKSLTPLQEVVLCWRPLHNSVRLKVSIFVTQYSIIVFVAPPSYDNNVLN
ncbi:hypothetical protein TNCV_4976401 [Trichonephila clavipes]|nr:hypothetical protein TNCV_4976401 [Trichonephila clavipes]